MSDYPHDGSQRPLHTPEPPDVITARVFACLDACAGMDDPAAEIAALRKQIKILEIKNKSSLANNLCPDCRDKQTFKSCLSCENEKLRANQQVLVDALEKVLIGGNHAANYLLGKMTPEDLDKLPPKTPPIIALHQLDNDVYDVWCCWASVMTAREALNKIKESENEV